MFIPFSLDFELYHCKCLLNTIELHFFFVIESRYLWLKNENGIDDVVNILDTLHQYVPKHTITQTIDVPTKGGCSRKVDIQSHHFHHILVGGDYLTAAWIQEGGSQKAQQNGKERLEGRTHTSN